MQVKRRSLPAWQRIELAEKVVLEGWTCREAAAWRHVSPATMHYWVSEAGHDLSLGDR